jgi:hypothetical protein
MSQAEMMRQVLYILAGMSGNFYPEQMYRAALIITLQARGYVWEHIAQCADTAYDQALEIYFGWRKRHVLPYLALTPLHQEVVKIRGRLRVAYFEELDTAFLNTAVRKMIIFPHGIYTITYKRRGRGDGQRAGQLQASLQKGRQINGRNYVRAIHLGNLGDITKEGLRAASFAIERKFTCLGVAQA